MLSIPYKSSLVLFFCFHPSILAFNKGRYTEYCKELKAAVSVPIENIKIRRNLLPNPQPNPTNLGQIRVVSIFALPPCVQGLSTPVEVAQVQEGFAGPNHVYKISYKLPPS